MAEPFTTSRLREAPAAEAAARIASRRKTADQRLRILERLTVGLSLVHIARVEKLTVRRVQQIIAATPSGNMAFLTTPTGRPYTASGFGDDFRMLGQVRHDKPRSTVNL